MADCCIGVEIGNEKALAEELEKYLDGFDYSAMIEHAFETTQKKFTVDVMTDQIMAIYQRAIEG